MRNYVNYYFIFLLYLTLFLCSNSYAYEKYKMIQMWPQPDQPWYFNEPTDIEIDNDMVYIADSLNHRIKVFTEEGILINQWGEAYREFFPSLISVSNDFIYVAHYDQKKIQQFSKQNSQLIWTWQKDTQNKIELSFPTGIAVDKDNFVYIVDSYNHRIIKLNSKGNFELSWGKKGVLVSQFYYPTDIAIDSDEYVYISDTKNNRIQKFTNTGDFIEMWPTSQLNNTILKFDKSENLNLVNKYSNTIYRYSKDFQLIGEHSLVNDAGKACRISGITYNDKGDIFITDAYENSISKFEKDYKKCITTWKSHGNDEGKLNYPSAIDCYQKGSNTFIFVADTKNNRIQEFSSEGTFLNSWGSSNNISFNLVTGLALDYKGNVYIVDSHLYDGNNVYKYSNDGEFIQRWGSKGQQSSQFRKPMNIAIEDCGLNTYVYVVDTKNHRIQKFSDKGDFICSWGKLGNADGEFILPSGIAVYSNNSETYIYVSDTVNHRIQAFSSSGSFLHKWGIKGSQSGELNQPTGIVVDNFGSIFVADTSNNRIVKFSPSGKVLSSFGEFGTNPGQLSKPKDLSVSQDGTVFIADTNNNRIQAFRKILGQKDFSKAIIIEGGASMSLKKSFQHCSQLAYKALLHNGFSKEAIYYLANDTDIDPDHNGDADDVDAKTSISNIDYAINNWTIATPKADNVLIYFVGHGWNNRFMFNEHEVLFSNQLNIWLNTIQNIIPGRLFFISENSYEMSSLLPSARDKKRILISGTLPQECPHFFYNGLLSFSTSFWSSIFYGNNVGDSFQYARKSILYLLNQKQHPQLDSNVDGICNQKADIIYAKHAYIQNDLTPYTPQPNILDITPSKVLINKTSDTLYVNEVFDSDGIEKVWGVIYPPIVFAENNDNEKDKKNFDIIDFHETIKGRYEATYSNFVQQGNYNVYIYAKDYKGNTSYPKSTVISVNQALYSKAIIIEGQSFSGTTSKAFRSNASMVYKNLKSRGYSDDNIYFLSAQHSNGVDETISMENIKYAFNIWAFNHTSQLLIYMIGEGQNEQMKVNDNEILLASDLNLLMNNVQNNMPGIIVLIYDACNSGSFIARLNPPKGKKRILITSSTSNQQIFFNLEGTNSFSTHFFNAVLSGATIRNSWLHAKRSLRLSLLNFQTPCLDDNGNGICNEKTDGKIARQLTIGSNVITP